MSLGAAGCMWITENALCGFCNKDAFGNFYCVKFNVDLKRHHKLDQPWRAKECSADADGKIWNQIQEEKKKPPQNIMETGQNIG